MIPAYQLARHGVYRATMYKGIMNGTAAAASVGQDVRP